MWGSWGRGERTAGRNGYENHHQTRWQEVLVGDPHDHRGLEGDTKDGGTTDQDGNGMIGSKVDGRHSNGFRKQQDKKMQRGECVTITSGTGVQNAGPVKQGDKPTINAPLVADAQAPIHASSVV